MISGPDATAGSTFIFLNANGTAVPQMLESRMDTTSAMPVHSETENAIMTVCPFSATRYSPMHTTDNVPRIRPFTRPTRASLPIRNSFCLPLICSSISTRMVTARDCVPTLPAMSRISDWKLTISVRCATTCSNMPTTLETTSPRPSRTISQGRRFPMLLFSGSFRSSSADRPASLA